MQICPSNTSGGADLCRSGSLRAGLLPLDRDVPTGGLALEPLTLGALLNRTDQARPQGLKLVRALTLELRRAIRAAPTGSVRASRVVLNVPVDGEGVVPCREPLQLEVEVL